MGNKLVLESEYVEERGVPVLYYDELSPQCRSCFMLICLLDIDVQLIPTNLNKKSQRNHQFQTNPAGVIPALIDGQVILNDAHTIMIYLCDKYGCSGLPHVCPRDYLPRLIILNMLFYEGCVLYRLYTLVMTEIFQKNFSMENLSIHQKKVIESYDKLETHLQGQLCMTGHSLTIADLSIVCTASSLDLIYPITSQQWPNFRRWFENIKAMDCYKCNAVGVEKLYILLQAQGRFPITESLQSLESSENTELAKSVSKTLDLSTSFPKIRTKRMSGSGGLGGGGGVGAGLSKAIQSFESDDNVPIGIFCSLDTKLKDISLSDGTKIKSYATESTTVKDDERPCCSSYNLKELGTNKPAKKKAATVKEECDCSDEESGDAAEESSDSDC